MTQDKEKGLPEDFDYESFRKQVIAGLMQGQALTGESGLLKPLIADFIQGALDAELQDHLDEERAQGLANRRNGKQNKQVRTESGEVPIEYGRDRNGSFEPVTVKKRDRQLGLGFDNQILELYAMSNSVADIRLHLERMYGAEMSESRISAVINSTWDRVKAWHERPLAALFVVLFIDAVHIKVRRNDGVATIALYVIYGISAQGQRELVALYPGQGAESATEWGRCLQDLKNRGLEDVLIICSDGLAGLKPVIAEAFPLARIQRCVVHKIRNCFKLMDNKDSREILRQLKSVYMALNEAAARLALEDFNRHWNGKYKTIVDLWEKDWDELMACMDLSITLRTITYTTNAIENLNREIRRVTKTKGAWVSDRALLIQLFLSLERSRTSWHKNVHNWANVRRELIDTFGNRFSNHLDQ
ncbi:MAG TPA: IS256 family transposase [Saprospiraceae bacterium]|nr:IS256 family transposase [Saprospiraceae bacterium]